MKKKVGFTCTEHFGKEDINELILRPLVDHINESFGREIVVIKDEVPEPEQEEIAKAPPPEIPVSRKNKKPKEEITLA